MPIIQGVTWDERGVDCPYLPERKFHQEWFLAQFLDSREWGEKLRQGYRRFGRYFFRPQCPGCLACKPLRIKVQELYHSKSQRRIWRKNNETEFRYGPMDPRPEIFSIYRNHSLVRFGQDDKDFLSFLQSFYFPGAPALQTEYWIEGRLAGVGFCDVSDEGLSSVYFVFHEDFQEYNLGTYSILREAELAKSLGKHSYYLGYYIEENPSMAYKGRFFPREIYDWDQNTWKNDE
jgi:arginyl-tRNA--protein-N-Asp/Glu arginylyltransferase